MRLGKNMQETGPAILTQEQVRLNGQLISGGITRVYHYQGLGRFFTEWGTLKVRQRTDLQNPEIHAERFWSGRLLRRDPDSDRLKTSSKGAVWVFDNSNALQDTIWPEDVRLVKKGYSYRAFLHEGGFLLRDTRHDIGGRAIFSEEYAQILRDAELGKEPEAYKEDPYMKICTRDFSPGSEFDVVFFDPGRNNLWWNMDGVVIAPNRTLVPRTITHPLNPYHWVQPMAVDSLKQVSVPLSST